MGIGPIPARQQAIHADWHAPKVLPVRPAFFQGRVSTAGALLGHAACLLCPTFYVHGATFLPRKRYQLRITHVYLQRDNADDKS